MPGKESQTSASENLQLAQILSDITSLRVCEPSAALALVSARPSGSLPPSNVKDPQDPDLQRAKELVELHYTLREAHRRGDLARGLEEAREAVNRAVPG